MMKISVFITPGDHRAFYTRTTYTKTFAQRRITNASLARLHRLLDGVPNLKWRPFAIYGMLGFVAREIEEVSDHG